MKKSLILAIVSYALSGCATPMSDAQYIYFASQASATERCFNNNHISAELYANGVRAIAYNTSTWKYDREKLLMKHNKINKETRENSEAFDAQFCNQFSATLYQTIAQASQHRDNAREAKRQLKENNRNNTQRTTTCNTIGTQTSCTTY